MVKAAVIMRIATTLRTSGMIRKRILLAAALLSATMFASAAQWAQIATSQDGVSVEVDLSSIERAGAGAKIWERRFFTPPRTWGQGDTTPTQTAKVHIFFNCANKTVAYKST